jgi:hypothetical protein
VTRVRVTHHIDDLASDLAKIAVDSKATMARTLRQEAELGNELAKGFARKSAGKHGKHYPSAFSAESRGPLSWEYGPDSSMPQGGMSFEFGSRNQPPHLDLARSADIIAARLGEAVLNDVDDLFWPGA